MAKKYPVGTKLVVLAGGVGQGCPELKQGQILVVTRDLESQFDFTIDGVLHTGWGWHYLGNYFDLPKKKLTIII